MAQGELFSVDFNSIGEGNLLEVDVPQATNTVAATGGEDTGTADNAPKGDKIVDKTKDKKNAGLFEVDAKGDEDNSVAPAATTKPVITDKEKGDKKTDEDTTSSNSPSSGEHSPFTPFAKALHEEGILPNLELEKFDGTADGLFEAVRHEVHSGIESYKESLPPVVREIIDNYEEGVPLDKLIESKSKQIEYASISKEDLDSNDSLQKVVIRDLLKAKGIKETKIEKIIESFEDGGKLKEEAYDSLSELQDINKEFVVEQKKVAEQRNKETARKNAETLSTLRNIVDKTEEIIPELKLNKTVKDRIYNSMTTVTSVDERGNPMNKVMEIRSKDPHKFEMVLHYLADLGVFEGDWSKIKTKAKTSAVKELEEKISKDTSFAKGNGGSATSGMKTSSIMESLRQFRR